MNACRLVDWGGVDQNSIYMNNIARVTRNFDLHYEVRNEPFHSRAGSHCYCSLEASIELYRKVSPHNPVVHDFRPLVRTVQGR